MSRFHKDNTRIFKNTLIIYVRMLLIIIIGILCTRYVLAALGKSDYGLYSVVGGLIAMLGFLSTAMSTTTRRFINIELGKPCGDPNKIFNICMAVHAALALFILLLSETIGLYYIHHWLNVDPSRIQDAVFVFQVSVIAACINILNLPYQSLMEAFERFLQTSSIDIISNLFKLAAVIYLLKWYSGDGLRLYAVIMAAMTLISTVLCRLYCRRSWPEIIRFRPQRDKATYREVVSFNNYTAMSAAAYIARTQGSTLIVNYFFGTIVNSALSVAYQLENFSVTSVNRLTNAAAPQITKNYSGGNTERSLDLVYKISRYSALLMTVLVFCVYVELDFVLGIWLKDVPEGAAVFTRWTLASALVRSFVGGTQSLEQATGKIKWFQIWNSTMSLLCLPLAFVAYKLGAPVVTVIQLYICYAVLYRFVEFALLHRLLGFDVWKYCKEAYLRPFVVVGILVLFMAFYGLCIPDVMSAAGHMAGILLTFAVAAFSVFFVGMPPGERRAVFEIVVNRLKK